MSTLDEFVSALGAQLHLVVEYDGDRMELAVPSLRQGRIDDQRREYRVIWQDQETRALAHVGWLEFTGDQFIFSYTEGAKSHPGFSPFPAFPQIEQTYRSADLFPFFSIRLTSTADPQFDSLIGALGLTRHTATPAELLARSPSASSHDTIQVVPEPIEKMDGTLERLFLVSGVRHADEHDPERVSRLVERLAPGTQLRVLPEPTNPKNPRAVQLAVENSVIGWVPEYLVDEIQTYLKGKRPMYCVVERANGPETPWHLRLLCRLTAAPASSD